MALKNLSFFRALSAAYLVLVALSGLVLLWWLNTRIRDEEGWFSVVLIFGLLFYPASLRSYTVLLIVPILFLIATKARFLPIGLAFGLTFFGGGNYVALATLTIGISLVAQMTGFRPSGVPGCFRSLALFRQNAAELPEYR